MIVNKGPARHDTGLLTGVHSPALRSILICLNTMPAKTLNEQAFELALEAFAEAGDLRISGRQDPGGPLLLDFGIDVAGGLEAGLRLAEICLSGQASVDLVVSNRTLWSGQAVQVMTDHPISACMASQYAGWKLTHGKFFAMGSGPMRAAAAKEPLFQKIGCHELSEVAVGVLETRQNPPHELCAEIAADCRVAPTKLVLCLAPTASQAGTVQVVARSVETCLHKLLELGFDPKRIESAIGTAPLPPVAKDDLAAIGRTNDAVLYGGEVDPLGPRRRRFSAGNRPSRSQQRLARLRRAIRRNFPAI